MGVTQSMWHLLRPPFAPGGSTRVLAPASRWWHSPIWMPVVLPCNWDHS